MALSVQELINGEKLTLNARPRYIAIPIILKRMNIYPALATGPFITTTNDIIGIAIYLGLAFNVSFSPLINTWLLNAF